VLLHTWCPPHLTTKQITMKIEKQIYENNIINIMMKFKFKFNTGKFRYMLITNNNKHVHIYKRYFFFIWRKYCTFPYRELEQSIKYLKYLQER
jgi:hypothetical protein